MYTVLLCGAVSFIITFLALPAIIKVASEKKLFDLPDARKVHTKAIASLGGVGIFIGFFLAILLTGNAQHSSSLQFVFAAAIVIFFLGLKDDILVISASKKFLGQLAAAAILIHLGNVRIESMHGFLGIGALPNIVSYLISYITIIVVVNAYNLIDGVDGLAGSLGVLTTSVFGVYFLYAGIAEYAVLAFAMTGALLAFLWYNFHPARIFMGDSGSLMLGLVNAVLVVKFITVADASASGFPITASVALGFSVLFVPLFDTLRVFATRISKGRSPFSPDRNHIHHLLLDRKLNHRQTALSCLALNVAFIAMAYLGRNLGSTILIVLMITIGFGLTAVLFLLRKPVRKLMVARSFEHAAEAKKVPASSTKVVSLKSEAVVAEH